MTALVRGAGIVRAMVDRHFERAALPRMLTYTVTFTCNARCVMCDSWRKDNAGDLTLDEVQRIFATLPRMDIVRLTGGEPFVRRDLTEIAEAAATSLRPALIHVSTNGFLTERIVEFCERRPHEVPLHVMISLDGLADRHDEIRGRAASFSRAMRTLEALAPRRSELRLTLSVNQTVLDGAGAREYRALRDRLRPLGLRNHVVVAYKESATYSLLGAVDVAPRSAGSFEPFGDLTRGDLERLFAEIEEDLRSYPLAERAAKRYYLDGIRSRLLGSEPSPNPKCVALQAHMRLFPNGDVPVCQFNGTRVGNLRSQAFADVWFGQAAQDKRAWVRACPGCWAECEVLPSAIYTGDLLRSQLLPARAKRAPASGGGKR